MAAVPFAAAVTTSLRRPRPDPPWRNCTLAARAAAEPGVTMTSTTRHPAAPRDSRSSGAPCPRSFLAVRRCVTGAPPECSKGHPTSVRGAVVKGVSPAERGRSVAEPLDDGEHTLTLSGPTMPVAAALSWVPSEERR